MRTEEVGLSWALHETMEAEATAVAALQVAGHQKPVFYSLLFHSD
ncbi:hypothetical protein ACMA1I_15015 [Pontibacter sp. 13R65]